MTGPVLMVAGVHGLSGRRGELRALLSELAAASRGEEGCGQARLTVSVC